MNRLQIYINKLKAFFTESGNVAIAYSGGMDSTFLALAAQRILPNNYMIVFVMSEFISQHEYKIALDTSERHDFKMKIIHQPILTNSDVIKNCPDRCYFCKRAIFSTIISEIDESFVLCDGSVIDDDDDYRPGKKALRELGVQSPLKEAGISKAIIAEILESWHIKNVVRPAQSCLATRMQTGEEITQNKLSKIEKSEAILVAAGVLHQRCRYHGDILRIEISGDSLNNDISVIREQVLKLKAIGFKYVTIDVEGYKRGSMN